MAGTKEGVGGIYNRNNSNLYHYSNNNPVTYTDPDGRLSGRAACAIAGGIIGGAAATVKEVSGRMSEGQNFNDAFKNTFTDKKSLAVIGASTLIGAATGAFGAAAGDAVAGLCSVTLAAESAKTAVVVETVAEVAVASTVGAIDAGVKDVTEKAIKGEEQNPKETAEVMGKAAVASGITAGLVKAPLSKFTNCTKGEISKAVSPGRIFNKTPYNIEKSDAIQKTGIVAENIVNGIISFSNEIFNNKKSDMEENE